MSANADKLSFWEHLDELRTVIIRCIVAVLVLAVVAFMFKDEVFAVILAPKDSGFVTYRFLFSICGVEHVLGEQYFSVSLINTELAQQFIIHMKVALCVGVLCASPYIIYQLYRFVSPALYVNERRYAVRVVGSGYMMFVVGVLMCYFLIFPLTFRFLGTYQVSSDVENMVSIDSYISTLLAMSLALGIMFELPVISWLFAKFGLLSARFMRFYRRHAVVVILSVCAVITPTSDVFTLLVVSLPMWLLYELSILIVSHTKSVAVSHNI